MDSSKLNDTPTGIEENANLPTMVSSSSSSAIQSVNSVIASVSSPMMTQTLIDPYSPAAHLAVSSNETPRISSTADERVEKLEQERTRLFTQIESMK